jgi:asparagine synthase (glutamine-hydrolysing)
VAQNGEIYNFGKLRGELQRRGYRFKTHSDTEVILGLYEKEGLSFVEKLRGMFAIVIWDKRKQRLVLARDRIGIKPLYYSIGKESLFFASEAKGILAAGVKREIDRQALWDYLSFNFVPGPRSIFEGIKKLGAGEMLVWESSSLVGKAKVRIKKYWDYPQTRSQKQELRSENKVEKELMKKLKEAVKISMVSDVPVGAFLSGGIDSSAVVGMASKVTKEKLKTFSVGFEDESYDETNYARLVAKRFGTRHQVLKVKYKVKEVVLEMAKCFDEPFGDSSAFGLFLVSGAAKPHVKVILTGDGGDEVFGGYVIYQADKLLRFYSLLPKVMREKMTGLASLIPATGEKTSFDFKLKRFLRGGRFDPGRAHFLWRAIFTEEEKEKLIKAKWGKMEESFRFYNNVFKEYKTKDKLNSFILADSKVNLVDDMLTKTDRMSMWHGLEVRVPLLDHELVEFMSGLPSDLKIKGMNLKYIFKKVLRGFLPDEILDRPKAGFHVPVPRWIKGELRELIGEFLSEKALKKQGLFEPEFIGKMIEEQIKGKEDWSRNIWGILMFCLWERNYAGA